MKLLYIEDNKALIKSLDQLLGNDAVITTASEGKTGLELAAAHSYDVILLDLGLPDMPGADVCAQLRKADITAPILVLSGLKELNTKISLLEAGADDYMTKPFSVAELRARLFALLRRGIFAADPPHQYVLRVNNLTLDPISRRVERSGKQITLRRKEFDILEYLMRNQGKIMTRSMIMDHVWESNSSSWEGTVNVHIKSLRDKIDRPYRKKLIKTVYGLGYTISDS